MTEDMKSGISSSNATTNCRPHPPLTMQSGTMEHSVASESLQQTAAATSNQPSLLPDASSNTPRGGTRLNPKDMANSDFVNRLLAASRITDFYSANIAPHSFFYSEMLRSLVQSRNEPTTAADLRESHQAAAAYNSSLAFPLNNRRNRKRAWPHRFSELSNENAVPLNNPNNTNAENDLKLTKIRKREDKDAYLEDKISPAAVDHKKSPLIFPPSTPWYPPYPPFFIDLRVSSGHVYDNSEGKSKTSPPLPAIGLDAKARQGSAFTVPPSSRNCSSMAPINLSTGQLFKEQHERDEDEMKRYSKLRYESDEVIAVVDDNDL